MLEYIEQLVHYCELFENSEDHLETSIMVQIFLIN